MNTVSQPGLTELERSASRNLRLTLFLATALPMRLLTTKQKRSCGTALFHGTGSKPFPPMGLQRAKRLRPSQPPLITPYRMTASWE